jgi:voltage-gated potassium channel Kch
MAATTVVHAGCTGLLLRVLRAIHVERWVLRSGGAEALVIAGVVVLLFVAALVEAAIWALTYLRLGALSTLEEALYFSIVTFTTLGFGDITLSEGTRLLASFEAANGIILFGWSTALVFAFLQRMAQDKRSSRDSSEG